MGLLERGAAVVSPCESCYIPASRGNSLEQPRRSRVRCEARLGRRRCRGVPGRDRCRRGAAKRRHQGQDHPRRLGGRRSPRGVSAQLDTRAAERRQHDRSEPRQHDPSVRRPGRMHRSHQPGGDVRRLGSQHLLRRQRPGRLRLRRGSCPPRRGHRQLSLHGVRGRDPAPRLLHDLGPELRHLEESTARDPHPRRAQRDPVQQPDRELRGARDSLHPHADQCRDGDYSLRQRRPGQRLRGLLLRGREPVLHGRQLRRGQQPR